MYVHLFYLYSMYGYKNKKMCIYITDIYLITCMKCVCCYYLLSGGNSSSHIQDWLTGNSSTPVHGGVFSPYATPNPQRPERKYGYKL